MFRPVWTGQHTDGQQFSLSWLLRMLGYSIYLAAAVLNFAVVPVIVAGAIWRVVREMFGLQ